MTTALKGHLKDMKNMISSCFEVLETVMCHLNHRVDLTGVGQSAPSLDMSKSDFLMTFVKILTCVMCHENKKSDFGGHLRRVRVMVTTGHGRCHKGERLIRLLKASQGKTATVKS